MQPAEKMENQKAQPSGWTNEELPPPSRPHLWFFGGCGALVLMFAICAVGTVLVTTKFGQTQQADFIEETKLLLKSSPTVIELLGEPIEADSQIKMESSMGGMGSPDSIAEIEPPESFIEVTLKGSRKSGVVKIKGKFVDGVYIRGETTLEVDGELILLNLDEELIPEIEINLGID